MNPKKVMPTVEKIELTKSSARDGNKKTEIVINMEMAKKPSEMRSPEHYVELSTNRNPKNSTPAESFNHIDSSI